MVLVAPDVASWPSGHCSLKQRQMWWTVLLQSWADRIIARSVLNLTCAMKCGITWQPKTVPMIAVRAYIGRVQLQCHLFFKVHTRGRWVVSFTACMFYPHEMNPHLPLNWRLCRPHIWSGHFWRRDNSLAFGRNWRPYCPFHTIVTISAKLSHHQGLLVLSTLPEPDFLWSEQKLHQDILTVIHCLPPKSSKSLYIQRNCCILFILWFSCISRKSSGGIKAPVTNPPALRAILWLHCLVICVFSERQQNIHVFPLCTS
jgi:hypothetical protein